MSVTTHLHLVLSVTAHLYLALYVSPHVYTILYVTTHIHPIVSVTTHVYLMLYVTTNAQRVSVTTQRVSVAHPQRTHTSTHITTPKPIMCRNCGERFSPCTRPAPVRICVCAGREANRRVPYQSHIENREHSIFCRFYEGAESMVK